MTRLERSLRRMSRVVACLLLLCSSMLVSNVSAQNGFTANELTTGITPGASIDALWADGNDHRWKIAVTNSTGTTTFTADMALWPCTTQTGGMVYAGGTDFEIYWRDLSLAYDKNNYCTLAAPNTCAAATSVSLSGWLTSYPQARGFFQDVGQGGGTYCTGSGYQTGSTGNCEYQSKTDAAHGQH